jgi:hypothetical protein
MLKLFILAGSFIFFHKLNLLSFNEEALIGLASLVFFILVYSASKKTFASLLFLRSNNLYLNIRYLLIMVKVTLLKYRRMLYLTTILKRSKNAYFFLNYGRRWNDNTYKFISSAFEISWIKLIIYNYYKRSYVKN